MRRWLKGPRLVALAVIVATAIGVFILAFDLHDVFYAEKYPSAWAADLVWALRLTVTISALFFLPAFTARPLNDLFHTRATRWLVKNRRYFGLACAAFLLQHLWLLPLMHIEYRILTIFLRGTNLFGAGAILLLATLLTVTSFNAAQRSIPGWKWLHWTGVNAMWFWYMKAYYGEYSHKHHPYQLVLLILVIAAMAIRLAAWVKRAVTPPKGF